jgi:hypothetical protein
MQGGAYWVVSCLVAGCADVPQLLPPLHGLRVMGQFRVLWGLCTRVLGVCLACWGVC